MIDTPQIIQTAAQHVAVLHVTVSRSGIREVMGPGYRELMETLAAQGVTPIGPWFNYHHRMNPDTFDFEIGAPVAAPIVAAGRVAPWQLPAARVARTRCHGPYEGLSAGWGEFEAWIAAQGLKSAPDLWETYVIGPGDADPAGWATELTRPLLA